MGPVQLLFQDSVNFEHWQLGDGDYYFHNRNDIPAASSEWFVVNNAVLLLEIPLHPNTSLRVGGNDELVANFGAGQISNSLRGMAMLHIARAGRVVRELTPAVLIGGRTHHPVRQGDLTFTIAVSFKLDLLAARKKAARTASTASAALPH